LWRFTRDFTDEERQISRNDLSDIINSILSIHPELNYFQGYHDIASVYLLTCGANDTFYLMERISTSYIKDCMGKTLEPVIRLLSMLFPLIEEMDTEVSIFLKNSEVQPFFALSWVLTWYSYGLEELDLVCRLYDFLMASHPLSSLYLGAVIVCSLKEDLLNVPCEFSAVHTYLNNLKKIYHTKF